MKQAELVVDAKAVLGEGPSWDEYRQLLYWVDILGEQIHIYNPKTKESRIIKTGQMVGAVVPRKSSGVMLAMQNGFYSLDLDQEKFSPIFDPEADLPTNRFNDGKCDAAGNFWAGTMDLQENQPTGSLYRLGKDLSVQKAWDQVTVSNGMAWEKDNQTMYYIDTPTRKVVAFDFDLDLGKLSNKREVFSIPDGEGYPDGMTIDEEGMLWVAHWGGYQVSRWNPQTGQKLEAISVPAARVTSCVFAGEQLDELYITTARIGLDEEALKLQPHAGGLFRVKMNVRGTRTYGFAG